MKSYVVEYGARKSQVLYNLEHAQALVNGLANRKVKAKIVEIPLSASEELAYKYGLLGWQFGRSPEDAAKLDAERRARNAEHDVLSLKALRA